jgi:hypothetical protein
MTTKIWACAMGAAVLAAMPGQAARADPMRSMFCIAIRSVPKLDQDNYVLGRTGSNYLTRDFTTADSTEDLIAAWKAFAEAYPRRYPDNPDDNCYPASARRAVMSDQHGEIRNINVAWPPGTPPKPAAR